MEREKKKSIRYIQEKDHRICWCLICFSAHLKWCGSVRRMCMWAYHIDWLWLETIERNTYFAGIAFVLQWSYCSSGMLLLIPEFLTLHFRFSIWGIRHPSDFESVIFGLSGWNVYIVGLGGRCSFIQRYLKIHCYLCNGITWSVLHTGSYIQLSGVGIIIISIVADLELA